MRNALLTKECIVRSSYKTDRYYRFTLFVAIFGLITAAILAISSVNLKSITTSASLRENNADAEESVIANRHRELLPTIESYAQISNWASHQRLSFSPVLDWIEKAIPPESSISELDISLDKITPGSPRTATLKMTVYMSAAAGPAAEATTWVDGIKAGLTPYRISSGTVKRTFTDDGEAHIAEVSVPLKLINTQLSPIATPNPQAKPIPLKK